MIEKDKEKKKKEEKDKLKKQQKEERKWQWQKEQAQKEKEQTEKAKQAEKNPYSVFAEKVGEEVMDDESVVLTDRLRAKKVLLPPPLGNFADVSYLEENFKPHLLRDVCTLCSGALVSDSLLHMLL